MAYGPVPLGQYSNNGKGICLDVYGGVKNNHTQIISYPCHGGPNQQFRFNKKYGTLQAQHSKKCVYYNNNDRLEQNTCILQKKKKTKRNIKKRKSTRKRRRYIPVSVSMH
jgi:hypothetical protein